MSDGAPFIPAPFPIAILVDQLPDEPASLPMTIFSAPVVISSPASLPMITESTALVMILPAPIPTITLLFAALRVPVVISPNIILSEKLGELNITSTKSFNFFAPAYSPVTTPPDV